MGNGPQQTRIGSVTWCAITLAATLAIFIADATKTRPEIVTTWKLLAWAFAFAATVWLWGQTARSLLPIGRAQEGQRLWKRGIAEIVWLAPAYMVLSTLAPPLFAAMVLSAANLVRIWAWNIHTRRKPPSPPGPRAWPDFEAAFVARGLSRVFPVCMLTGAALSLLLVEKMRRDDFDQALLLGMIAAGGSAIAVFFDLLPNEVLLRWRRLALPLAATALLLYLLTPSKQLMPGVAQAARLPDFVRLQAASNAAPPVGIGRGAFPGVILRPRFHEKLSKTIVAPAAILGAASSESLGISFAGEYWFFRTPDTAPPPHSIVRELDPTRITLRTTGGEPLIMEARQQFDPAVDLTQFQALEVHVEGLGASLVNASVEALLIDSVSGTKEGLGRLGIQASANLSLQKLRFVIPKPGSLDRADAVMLVFHQDRLWADRSLRLAVESIAFVR